MTTPRRGRPPHPPALTHQLWLRADTVLVEAIETIARIEGRDRSTMTRILLREAVLARSHVAARALLAPHEPGEPGANLSSSEASQAGADARPQTPSRSGTTGPT